LQIGVIKVGYQQKLRRVVSEMYWGRGTGEGYFMLPEILKKFFHPTRKTFVFTQIFQDPVLPTVNLFTQ
jgi:hypothetical protein